MLPFIAAVAHAVDRWSVLPHGHMSKYESLVTNIPVTEDKHSLLRELMHAELEVRLTGVHGYETHVHFFGLEVLVSTGWSAVTSA